MTNPLIRQALVLRLAMLASLLSLGAAFTAQYGFDFKPCHLCLAQRVPFALVIVLALLGLRRPHWRGCLAGLIGAAFLINSGIAAYHTAVEQHWVGGPAGCTSGPAPAHESIDEFLARIKAAPIVACDQPQWEYHGITMAAMNAAWCLLLAIATFVALRRSCAGGQPHA